MSGVTLTEVTKAQVATLFGKFRPAGNLSADEQNAIRAERVEFADRLLAFLRAIDANEPDIVQEIRRVTRELYNEQGFSRLPTPEYISSAVKRAFAPKGRPICFGCAAMGGRYLVAGAGAPFLGKVLGDVEYPGDGYLCLAHHHAAHWYAHREAVRRKVISIGGTPYVFEYPPPAELLPAGATAREGPAADPKWSSFTDGLNMSPLATWARTYVERRHGWRVGETETPLLADVVPDQWAAI